MPCLLLTSTHSSLPHPQLANIQPMLESMAASPLHLPLPCAPSICPFHCPSISQTVSSPPTPPRPPPSPTLSSPTSSTRSTSPAQQQHGVDGLVRELVLHGASEDWARGYIAEALLRPNVAAPKPLAVAIASGPPSPRASASHHECSQHELQQYAQAIRSAYVDASMSASEREVGTSLFVEELVAMGGKEVEQWARSFVAQSLATEVRKRKVVRA
ncbi:unnamed protein product [Closterium sp. NIES-65]|nr:unnamed protein product [Closterium sp. NIES-65]